VGKLLPVVVAHDEAGLLFFDGPRWRGCADATSSHAIVVHLLG
jgi:hypothetical protein